MNRKKFSTYFQRAYKTDLEEIKIPLDRLLDNLHLIASFAAKILPYRGLGSGIIRALKEQPNIKFSNDIEYEQFKVVTPRPEIMQPYIIQAAVYKRKYSIQGLYSTINFSDIF